MRIAGSEYLKLFSNKIFLICIIAFFCADSLFFVMLQSSDYENSAISSDVGAYEQLIRECNGAEDKNAFFESKNTEIQIAQILLHNGNADVYRKKYPKLYDNAAGLDLNDDELFNRSVMLSNIQAQLSHIDSYEEFIGQSFDLNSSIPKGTAAYYRLYSSNNSKIATATRAGGIVKGISVGRTTVTCTLNNGKKAICDVYVVPKAKKISNVPLIGQSKLPTGCETCSATMLLKHYGYNISETTFADKYLVKKPFGYSNGSYTGPDPNCAFVGTPYSSNSYGAYAPIMVKCMNKYLSDKSYKAVEISGKSLEYLSGKYVAQGQPIMIWATINMLPSFKTTSWRVNYTDENAKYKLGSYYTWIAREHCLVMTGYDNYYYYFNDPWTNARTRYSKSVVNSRYAELGKQAVVMVKK